MLVDLSDNKEVRCKFCGSFKIVRNGRKKQGQCWLCRSCGRGFMNKDSLPGMWYKTQDIARVLTMFYSGVSLSEIKSTLFKEIDLDPSYSTLYHWVFKFTRLAVESVNPDHPQVSRQWIVFGELLAIGGHKYWILDIVDIKTHFLIATLLTAHISCLEIDRLFNLAKSKTGVKPEMLFTDLPLFHYSDFKPPPHIQIISNLVASKYPLRTDKDVLDILSGLKYRSFIIRRFKTTVSVNIILAGWSFSYNYLHKNPFLQSQTPSKMAQIQYRHLDWGELVKDQSSKHGG
jgi:transposase-like protein